MPFGWHCVAKPKLIAKKFHFFPPHVFVTCGWPCTTKPVIHNGRASSYRPDRAILFFAVPVYFVSDLRDGVGARL